MKIGISNMPHASAMPVQSTLLVLAKVRTVAKVGAFYGTIRRPVYAKSVNINLWKYIYKNINIVMETQIFGNI